MNRWKAQVLVLEREGEAARIELPEGKRFVALVRGQQPSLIQIEEPGRYVVQADNIGLANELPAIIVTIHQDHVGAWLNLTKDQVARIFARVMRAAAHFSTQAGHA